MPGGPGASKETLFFSPARGSHNFNSPAKGRQLCQKSRATWIMVAFPLSTARLQRNALGLASR